MKFTNLSLLKQNPLKVLLIILTTWRIFLFLPFVITFGGLTIQEHYLGGGRGNYISSPLIWGWANFDGEHYLSIARHGYQPLSYFFFPLYPLLINLFAFGNQLVNYLTAGLFISHFSFFVAMVGLWKLLRIDYKNKTSLIILATLLVFPTTFYFVGVYTESLFLALVVWCFYFARKGKWYLVGLLGFLACSTRLVGIAIFPAMLFEWYQQYRLSMTKKSLLSLGFVLLIPLSLLLYMLFLHQRTGDALEFFNNASIFGDQRSSKIILLPQVFYRYIFKIIPVLNYSYWPSVVTPVMELLTGVIFALLSVYSFFKLRVSYAIYLTAGYLIPTLSGSFSSLPRYVLVLFPGFILLGLIINRANRMVKILFFSFLAIMLLVAQSMFIRGYWVS